MLFEWLSFIFVISLILTWIFIIREVWSFQRITKFLLKTKGELKDVPKVSVIVPAKDEEASIRKCLDSLAGQAYKNFECILVDDRSKDSTGAIMEEFAEKHSHFKMISIRELPEGWLGKNHALQKGAELSSGEYLLFTDGDVIFEKEAVLKSIRICVKNNLDHLTLLPKFNSRDWFFSALNVFYITVLISYLRPSTIGKAKRYHAGFGAFNMVKGSVYQSIGAHNKLRMEVLDDVMLGKLISVSGFSCAMAYGKGLVSLTWYANAKKMILGFEKNGFAAMEYSVFLSVLLGVSMLYFYFLPFVLIFFLPPFLQMGLILYFSLMLRVFFEMTKWLDYNPFVSLLAPFLAWIPYFAQVRSAFLNLTRGKVIWRETAYSLEELKSHRKRLSREICGNG